MIMHTMILEDTRPRCCLVQFSHCVHIVIDLIRLGRAFIGAFACYKCTKVRGKPMYSYVVKYQVLHCNFEAQMSLCQLLHAG